MYRDEKGRFIKGHKINKGRPCWCKGKKLPFTVWNKGLKFEKEDHPLFGKKAPWAKNNPQVFKKGHIPWNKGKKRPEISGINHFRWKGGISKTKEYRKLYDLRSREKRKLAGELTLQIVQQVYEDNIKKYGTLTCYLCEKSIEFGNDSIEHKIPLCRGGTNEKNNLAIAHLKCNHIKHRKTEKEFRNEVIKNGLLS